MNLSIYQALEEICEPLSELGISFFQYCETTEKGNMTLLCTNPYWYQYYVENQLYLISNFKDKPSSYRSGYILNRALPRQKGLCDVAENQFNISNGITLIEKNEDKCRFFMFCTTKEDTSFESKCFSYLELLKRFTLYFKDKARVIIKEANVFDISSIERFDKEHEFFRVPRSTLDTFLEKTDIKRYFYTGTEQYLTKKEVSCLRWLIDGKSSAEIAMLLGISQRTVEAHLNKVKLKFDCYKQSQLSYLLGKLGVNHILLE